MSMSIEAVSVRGTPSTGPDRALIRCPRLSCNQLICSAPRPETVEHALGWHGFEQGEIVRHVITDHFVLPMTHDVGMKLGPHWALVNSSDLRHADCGCPESQVSIQLACQRCKPARSVWSCLYCFAARATMGEDQSLPEHAIKKALEHGRTEHGDQ